MDMPAWMQVVERRREQAAEVVPIPLLWRGARQGGVVEPRLEQAAERSPGHSASSAESMDLFRASYTQGLLTLFGWRLPESVLRPGFPGSRHPPLLTCHARLQAGGQVLSKPLDSGLRRNDDRGSLRQGCCRARARRNNEGLSGWRATPLSPRRHSSAGWNPGRRGRGGEWMIGFTGWRVG